MGNPDTLALEICEAIRRRREKYPYMQLYGRFYNMRITFSPHANDVTSIRYKTISHCSRGPAAKRAERGETSPSKHCEWQLTPLVNWNTYAFPELNWSKTFKMRQWEQPEAIYKSALNELGFDLDIEDFGLQDAVANLIVWARERAKCVVGRPLITPTNKSLLRHNRILITHCCSTPKAIPGLLHGLRM